MPGLPPTNADTGIFAAGAAAPLTTSAPSNAASAVADELTPVSMPTNSRLSRSATDVDPPFTDGSVSVVVGATALTMESGSSQMKTPPPPEAFPATIKRTGIFPASGEVPSVPPSAIDPSGVDPSGAVPSALPSFGGLTTSDPPSGPGIVVESSPPHAAHTIARVATKEARFMSSLSA